MTTLNSTLQTSLTALQASTVGMATTNHNISNVNTPGYSRQTVNLSTYPALLTGSGFVGSGVKVDSITAFRDRFVEARLNQETSSQGKYSTLSNGLQQLEGLFNETSGNGISASMDSFFNSFSDLANHPDSLAARSVVVQNGKALAQNFNTTADRLQALQQHTDQSVADTVTQINALASQIANLNGKIGGSQLGTDVPNDLIDQRTEAIKQLSQLANVNTVQDTNGAVQVTIGSGRLLVGGQDAQQLTLGKDSNGLTTISLGGTSISGEINNGQLSGLLTARDNAIPQALNALNDVAALITSKVNQQHESGTGLNGTTGIDFFTPSPSSSTNAGAARAFAVNPDVAANLDKIAASQTGAAGDNGNALALAALQTQSFTATSGSGTFNQLYGSLVAQVGSQSKDAQDSSSLQDSVVLQVQNQRDAVSGVSLDEEAVNLMKYQRAFESASRVVRVVDELTQDVLNMVQ
jgi:flagellar hook-associated protein 1 FlgK